ncbi:MAG: N-6 DNA methylase [Gammaproteobacteria bacterium]|nr:N-6 DNA methylase [Gammaproteobacteria bacterium]
MEWFWTGIVRVFRECFRIHTQAKLDERQLGRYFTTPEHSQALIQALNPVYPRVLLELGAGDGALVAAAARRWDKAQVVTTDLYPGGLELPHDAPINHQHFCIDALEVRLPELLALRSKSVDVAVCNPPYFRPEWRPSFGSILEDAGLSSCFAATKDVTIDVLFLAQNLRLLRSQGVLGIIVPDGLVAGIKARQLRQTLVEHHGISVVYQLPPKAFRGTDARTHILVLSKTGGPARFINVYELQRDGQLSSGIRLDGGQARHRLDFAYWHHKIPGRARHLRGISIAELGGSVSRGTLPWRQAKELDIGAFHTVHFASAVRSRKVYAKRTTLPSTNYRMLIYAQAGDILLGRVGRHIHEQVLRVVGPGLMPLTDCVIRVRVPHEYQEAVWRFFDSSFGKEWIKANSRGVCARYLACTDVLESGLPLSLGTAARG